MFRSNGSQIWMMPNISPKILAFNATTKYEVITPIRTSTANIHAIINVNFNDHLATCITAPTPSPIKLS